MTIRNPKSILLLTFVALSLLFLGCSNTKVSAWSETDTPVRIQTIGGFEIGKPFRTVRGMAFDSAENIYAVDLYGHTIQKFDSSGNILSAFGIQGTDDGQLYQPSDVAVDSNGNIYVSEFGSDRIQKFDSNGNFVLKIGSLGSADGQFNDPWFIDVDSQNNLYVSDANNNRIQKFDSNGNFIMKFGTTGAGDGQFSGPRGIHVDANDNIFVADRGNNRIQEFDSNGNFILKFGTAGSGDGQFNQPYSLTTDQDGNIYVFEYGNFRIQKFDSNRNFIMKFGGNGWQDGTFNNAGDILVHSNGKIYTSATVSYIDVFSATGVFESKMPQVFYADGKIASPQGITVDNLGNIYVSEYNNCRVQVFNSNGNYVLKFGTGGSANGQFISPKGIGINSERKIYVVDYGNHRVQVFNPNGTFDFAFGSYGSGDGQFHYPYEISIDSNNKTYVTDYGNSRVQVFDANGTFLYKFGSSGSGDGQFSYPNTIAVSSEGNIYVADYYNRRVQVFDPNGTFLFKFGESGTGDGQFADTVGISIDKDDKVYVTDRGNNRVQVFNKNGTYLYKFGSGTLSFSNPIKVDATGKIYLVDSVNNRIYVFQQDREAPTGTLTINSGASFSTKRAVTLNTAASDALSAVTHRMISENADFASASWEAYTASKAYTFTSDGSHTIYAKYKDTFNTESAVYSASITVDTVKPTVRITDIGLISNVPDKTSLTYYFTSQTPLIKGNSEAGSTVHFKYGTKDYTAKVGADGKYSVSISNPALPRQLVKLSYFSQDGAGNKSETRTLTLIIGEENFPQQNDNSDSIDQLTPTPSISPIPAVQYYKYEIYDERGNALADKLAVVNGQEYSTDKNGIVYLEAELSANEPVNLSVNGQQKTGYVEGRKIFFGTPTPTITQPAKRQQASNNTYWWILLIVFVVIIGYLIRKYAKKST